MARGIRSEIFAENITSLLQFAIVQPYSEDDEKLTTVQWLGAVVALANVHDAKLLEATLDAIVVGRPRETEDSSQDLC